MASTPGAQKKQTATVLSTYKVKYLTGVNTGHEVVWECELYSELGFVQKLRTCFLTDNTFALQIIDSPNQVTNHTKHIHFSYHWIKKFKNKSSYLNISLWS